MTTNQFDHERLDVYQVAIEFISEADLTITAIPPGHAGLADQLRRAATSICLNIAEGSGEFSPKEKARFYRMAKRSAAECVAILDVLEVRARASLERESCEPLDGRSMLIKLVRRMEGSH